ncbi:MAG: MarR family winged helix-turn-helix transcriptional regulator [Thermoanaerobaculia bacterium]
MATTRIQQEIKQNKPFHSRKEEAAVALLRTTDLLRRMIGGVVESKGITAQQYNVLRILRGAGDHGLPTLDIAERMIEQTPGITRLIDRLETKDLVLRERCPTDRRQVFCRITRSGLRLLGSLDAPIRAAEERALSVMADRELTSFISLLDRARDGLRAALN